MYNKLLYTIVLFILLSFFVGFTSDLVLNYLSRQSYAPAPVKALEFYFKRKNIKSATWRVIISAINAGLTIAAALLITMGIYSLLTYLFVVGGRNSLRNSLLFLALAFIVGYALDVIIYKTQLFGPTLNPYYIITGAGLWGALSFIFAIIASFILYKMVI